MSISIRFFLIAFLFAFTIFKIAKFCINKNINRNFIQYFVIDFIIICYFLFLIDITLTEFQFPPLISKINLLPFSDLLEHIKSKPTRIDLEPFYIRNTKFLLVNYLGNIILFIPLGILIPIKFKNINFKKRMLTLGLCVSLFIELLQLTGLFRRSVFDITDIILNTFGTLIGYFFLNIIIRTINTKK